MTRQLVLDGMLSGTGIRDVLNGGYVDPEAVGVSEELASRIGGWLERYENHHFSGYKDPAKTSALDEEGIGLMGEMRAEALGIKIGYFSSALLKLLVLPTG